MNTLPNLAAERVTLRQLRLEDAAELFDYFSKDEVTEFYDLESFIEVKQAEELIHRWNDRYAKLEGMRWGITYPAEDKVIGTCGFHNWSKEHFKAEIGYELAPEHWRKGLMTEVIGRVVQYGFKELGLHRIEAFVDPKHIASRKLLEKAGFTEEGTLRDCFYEKGKFVDAVVYAILSKDHSGI
ncbi:putative N-acetyltransferase YoaA [Paenibacillus silvae]|uniref:N-acetyltransferase YoaA n=1 Tax=Paenibacillus silvae TaxID=1325358 RepID=A0ABQ1ZA40_9BACL|nr:GNAT family protein [Paenibacillus silvae]GGH55219.1 putative N-acetyltransferase YoaA [Paenibacillus silvae]